MSPKPLVEFTKFEFTRALLSLQKQVSKLQLLLLGGNGQGSVLQRLIEGPFVRSYQVAKEFGSEGKWPTPI